MALRANRPRAAIARRLCPRLGLAQLALEVVEALADLARPIELFAELPSLVLRTAQRTGDAVEHAGELLFGRGLTSRHAGRLAAAAPAGLSLRLGLPLRRRGAELLCRFAHPRPDLPALQLPRGVAEFRAVRPG